jgi:hypothetical protein
MHSCTIIVDNSELFLPTLGHVEVELNDCKHGRDESNRHDTDKQPLPRQDPRSREAQESEHSCWNKASKSELGRDAQDEKQAYPRANEKMSSLRLPFCQQRKQIGIAANKQVTRASAASTTAAVIAKGTNAMKTTQDNLTRGSSIVRRTTR